MAPMKQRTRKMPPHPTLSGLVDRVGMRTSPISSAVTPPCSKTAPLTAPAGRVRRRGDGQPPAQRRCVRRGGFGWHGLVDEVQIDNRTLTASEVAALHESGSAGQCKVPLGGVNAAWTRRGRRIFRFPRRVTDTGTSTAGGT